MDTKQIEMDEDVKLWLLVMLTALFTFGFMAISMYLTLGVDLIISAIDAKRRLPKTALMDIIEMLRGGVYDIGKPTGERCL
jgi:hypothetical protein